MQQAALSAGDALFGASPSPAADGGSSKPATKTPTDDDEESEPAAAQNGTII